MATPPDDARRLSLITLDELWSIGAPMVLPINGEPFCRLLLEPKSGFITLVAPYETPEPNVAKLKNVAFAAVSEDGNERAEITVRVEDNVRSAYGLLATIVDALQIDKMPLAAAVADGVVRYQAVLAARGAMTTEKEVGLLGELLFLEFLIRHIGAGPAISSWQGPLSEEHDFTFDSIHIEVKTTSGERRRHVVHGLDQLVPQRGVRLSVVSIQLTRSGPTGGRTLPHVVAQVRRMSGGHHAAVDAKLAGAGWRDDEADLYSTCWALRSEPRAYHVAGDFPAMTRDLVGPVVPNFELLSEVSYTVDLTDIHYDRLPDPLGGFVE